MSELVCNKDYIVLVNDGAVQSPTGQFQIKTHPDDDVLVNDNKCYFGDVEVDIPSGSTASEGTLSSTVTVTITASGESIFTDKGNALLKGDKSSGLDKGTFMQGQTPTTLDLQAKITYAGQTDVNAL